MTYCVETTSTIIYLVDLEMIYWRDMTVMTLWVVDQVMIASMEDQAMIISMVTLEMIQ